MRFFNQDNILKTAFAMFVMVSCGAVTAFGAEKALPARPQLTKLPVNFDTSMENTPVIFKGRVLLVQNERPAHGGDASNIFLYIEDIATGKRIAKFGELHSFVSAYVDGDVLNPHFPDESPRFGTLFAPYP